jgi:hypothetical protein
VDCERCGNLMQEDEAFISGDMKSLKRLFVLHCIKCGRREYRAASGIKSLPRGKTDVLLR